MVAPKPEILARSLTPVNSRNDDSLEKAGEPGPSVRLLVRPPVSTGDHPLVCQIVCPSKLVWTDLACQAPT
jgi:hypothetical protein